MIKRLTFYIIATMFALTANGQYRDDELGCGFKCRTIDMGTDYEGHVVCSIVKRNAPKPSKKALLYLHGFNDYFFQKELAERFNAEGYNFYALDLRKFGRSYLSHQKRCNMRNISEFFADIDTAVAIIKHEGNKNIIFMAHSMGGLTASLYCDAKSDTCPFDFIILNSPFLELNNSWFMRKIAMPVASLYANIDPDIIIQQGPSTSYGESLLKGRHGEWKYDETKKLSASPPVTTGWIHGIHNGQKKVHKGLNIKRPILVMYSDKSSNYDEWNPEMQHSDAVLNTKDIARYGKNLGNNVTMVKVKDGMHDLICSSPGVRNAVYKKIFSWIKVK
ncbi:MAG: alpha/beta hydrolase [Bacteroidales bacterium]